MKTIGCFILFISSLLVKAQDPSFYIFLCFGQSNMEGQGTIEGQGSTPGAKESHRSGAIDYGDVTAGRVG